MSKTAVQVDLVDQAEEKNTMRFVAVLNDGRLHSDEMYGFAREWGSRGDRTLYPFVLTDEDGDRETYLAEWGSDDESHVTLHFGPRTLLPGQLVTRVDVHEGQPEQSLYRIESITSMLD